MSQVERQQAKRERRLVDRQEYVSLGDELVSGALEAEHAPDFLLVHQGMRHEELNIQGALRIGESMSQHLSRAKGKRTVIIENAGGTQEQIRENCESRQPIAFIQDK